MEESTNAAKVERLKAVRKALDMTQQEFADKLGLSRGFLGRIETMNGEDASLSNKTIRLLENRLDVNPDYINYGTEPMFYTRSKSEIVTDFLADTLKCPDEDFKKRFIVALAGMSPDEWEFMAKMCKKIVSSHDQEEE